MTQDEPSPGQLRRDLLPLHGRNALVTGVSRRAGIGYAIARWLAAFGASLFLHQYAPHDREQPWGPGPDEPAEVIAGVSGVLAESAHAHRMDRRPSASRSAHGVC